MKGQEDRAATSARKEMRREASLKKAVAFGMKTQPPGDREDREIEELLCS